MAGLLIKAVIEDMRQETVHIRSYRLHHAKGKELPAFEAGAHIDVLLENGMKRQYSLASDPTDRTSYRIAVLREAAGKGGSAWIHDHWAIGQNVVISSPRNNFPLVETARHSVLIAGGIGITPFLAMIAELRAAGRSFELHYCARSHETAAFVDELSQAVGRGSLKTYFDGGDPKQGCDLQALLAQPEEHVHVYCCGPKGLIAGVEAASHHWDPAQIHFEHFVGLLPDAAAKRAFRLVLNTSGRVIPVAKDQTALQALSSAGVAIEAGCESGACGACVTRYLAGTVEPYDVCLSAAERRSLFTPCVSRASGDLLLDL